MRYITSFLTLSLFAASISYASPTPEEKAQAMQKMMAASAPGESHKILADMEGEYMFTSKAWESADSKPMESKGTSSMKMMLGGRWLQNTVKGEATQGMPAYEGIGLTGYDNVKKEFRTTWMDSFSSGPMTGSGSFDKKTKTLNDKGVYSCPLTGKDRSYRSEWKINNKNNVVFALFGTPMMDENGKEFKMMEMSFKRN